MLLIRILVASLLVVILNGCSWIYGKKGLFKDNEFSFVQAKMGESLKTPKGLKPILVEDELMVPAIGSSQEKALLGKRLDHSPPILILASGEKMDIDSENKAKVPRIWFRYNEIEFWQSIQDYLAKKDIAIASKDLVKGIIDTGWITETHESYWRLSIYFCRKYSREAKIAFGYSPSTTN